MRLGALGPAFGGALGRFLEPLFAFGHLPIGSGADLFAGADLLQDEPLELGAHRVDEPLRADRQMERGSDGRQDLRKQHGGTAGGDVPDSQKLRNAGVRTAARRVSYGGMGDILAVCGI